MIGHSRCRNGELCTAVGLQRHGAKRVGAILENTTMPVGVPPDAATEAVKVIGCSSVTGLAEEAMLVVVTDSGFCALALPVRSTATQRAK